MTSDESAAPADVTAESVSELPPPESRAAGTFDRLQPLAEAPAEELAGGPPPGGTELAGVERLRRVGAMIAFGTSTVGFSALVAYELGLAAKSAIDSWQAATWRAAIAISGALFAYALLRAADRLSMPLDMVWRVDVERAKAKGRAAEEAAVEMIKALAEVVQRLR